MIRIIGDLHGNSDLHINLMNTCEYSIQLGDLGFSYDYLNNTSLNHMFIGGNHDNYDVIEECPNYLGKYGMYILNDIKFFFVSGAYSIDQKYRIPFKSWWPSEELSYVELNDCIEMYSDMKPSMVLTHTAPTDIAKMCIGAYPYTPNRTSSALQNMFEIYQPAHWYFGHFHVNKHIELNNTSFVCVKDNEYVDVDIS